MSGTQATPEATILVIGATGATGRLLVQQLLDRGQRVRVIVRSPDRLPAALRDHERVEIVHASLLDLSDDDLARHVAGCRAVASCLGHTLSFRGLFGPPRDLVAASVRRLCQAVRSHRLPSPVRFVLMNTAGHSNRDLAEPVSFGQRCIVGLLRLLLPPHVDNERAADHLRVEIGQHDETLQWVAVRPDNLTDEDEVTAYDAHPSPIRSAIFDPGTTSRINVAHFMASLACENDLWDRWRGQMPVLYNRVS